MYGHEKEPKYVFKGELSKGSFVFNGAEVHTFLIDLSSKSLYEFKVYQNLPRQDFSIRLWFSFEERGLPISWGNSIKNINLRKFPLNIRVLYSDDKNEYKVLYTFLVNKREIYLNFQNLENSINGYRII